MQCLAHPMRAVSSVKQTQRQRPSCAVAAVRTARHAEAMPVRRPEEPPSLALAVAQGVCAALCSFALLADPGHASVIETSGPGTNVGFLSNDEILERRMEQGFTRAFDGRVALRSLKTKTFWDVKLDLKSPGTLLLRAPDGLVHVLAYETLTQIDLSDDEVVGAISNSSWEQGIKAVQAIDDDQNIQKLELTREGFYELISVVDP